MVCYEGWGLGYECGVALPAGTEISARCWSRCLTSGSCCWCVGYSRNAFTLYYTPGVLTPQWGPSPPKGFSSPPTGCRHPPPGAIFRTRATCALMVSVRFQSPQTKVCLLAGGPMVSVCFRVKKHLRRTKSDVESSSRINDWSSVWMNLLLKVFISLFFFFFLQFLFLSPHWRNTVIQLHTRDYTHIRNHINGPQTYERLCVFLDSSSVPLHGCGPPS